MNDWENQLALLLGQQDQQPQDYWDMMAAQDYIPSMTDPNAYVNKIQGSPQQQQLTPQQQQELLRQQQLQNAAARQGLAPQTPLQKQQAQIAEILRKRGLPSN